MCLFQVQDDDEEEFDERVFQAGLTAGAGDTPESEEDYDDEEDNEVEDEDEGEDENIQNDDDDEDEMTIAPNGDHSDDKGNDDCTENNNVAEVRLVSIDDCSVDAPTSPAIIDGSVEARISTNGIILSSQREVPSVDGPAATAEAAATQTILPADLGAVSTLGHNVDGPSDSIDDTGDTNLNALESLPSKAPAPKRDRNAEYRRMLLEEDRKAKRSKRVLGGLLEEEAEEEEEGGLQGGLGDFGFGVPNLRNDNEETVIIKVLD